MTKVNVADPARLAPARCLVVDDAQLFLELAVPSPLQFGSVCMSRLNSNANNGPSGEWHLGGMVGSRKRGRGRPRVSARSSTSVRVKIGTAFTTSHNAQNQRSVLMAPPLSSDPPNG